MTLNSRFAIIPIDASSLNGATNDEFAMITGATFDPDTAPALIGQVYINTDSKDIFISAGTGASSDWIKVN